MSNGVRLKLEAVEKRFGKHHVLQMVSVDVRPGKFIAVVGQSGGGKSTLLRLIAGLDSPSHGSVLVDNRVVTGIRPDTRVVFQEPRLLPWQSVIQNVQLGLPRSKRPVAHDALQWVGLEHKANEWPSVLSGGQKQRVALARALVWNPNLLLLDEPLGALDALTRLEMQRLIEQLWLAQGFTAVLVTHDIGEAVTLADRVVVLAQGGITLDVPVDLERPRRRDARFHAIESYILDHVLGGPPEKELVLQGG
jgi:sulfonate transport system ATP-binding protein